MASGPDAGVLEGVERARAADAALHLVEQEQQVVLVAQLAQARAGTRRAGIDAALALDGLDEDGRSVWSSMRSAKLWRLFSSPKAKPGTSGRKPFWIFSCGVALMPPNMRPWKAFLAQMTLMHLPSAPRLARRRAAARA